MARTEPTVIVICLGNPGERFAGSRHNAGFILADHLAQRRQFGPFQPLEGTEALAAEGTLANMRTLLVKPTTAMNDCGRVVSPLARDYSFDEHLWVVIHDDLDLPLGSVKGRQKGGHGGHNGVRSLLEAAGRRDLARVKLGVSSRRKADYESVADFLLSKFHPEELRSLQEVFPDAEKVLTDQINSFVVAATGRDRLQETARRYRKGALEEARTALDGIPASSPYPVILRGRQMRRAFDVVTALAKLLRKARALAAKNGGFRRRLVEFIPDELRPLLPPCNGSQRLFFAADLHILGQRLKVIELNCAVGYGHYAALADEALFPIVRRIAGEAERPNEWNFAAFLHRHGLRPLHESGAGGIAFLRGFGGEDMFNVDELEGVARRIERDTGLHVPLCHERDLALRKDGLYLGGTGRVDLLYVEENLSEWPGPADDSPVRRAVESGLVRTFPELEMFLYTSKGFLSLLADPEVQDMLGPDEAEQKVLRENILWSHPLDRHIEPAAYYMLEQGLRVVVKDALGGGGRGVTVLRPGSSSQQAGHILRRRMVEGRSIVQGYFEAGRWAEDDDLRFDVRVLCAAHEGDITIGPVYGRIFRGAKLSLSGPDAGVAPVYALR
ncbi:MAG: aminoacyl-tRNA hydrolase [Planctomycetes bacterium]|nr:aminoacyl-tRNA hydrolase [Planctomycetota bacterium]